MKARYQVVIFDLDGTLLDTLSDLGEAVNVALEKRGFPLHTREEYSQMVGRGVRNLVKAALPEGASDALIDECLKDFTDYYTAHIDVHTRPYNEIPELVWALHEAGAFIAVASNKFQSGAEHLVREFFPGIPFLAIFGNSPDLPLKPDPALISAIMTLAKSKIAHLTGAVRCEECEEETGGDGEAGDSRSTECKGPDEISVILVGDSPTDIKTAANAGIPAIAVTWGYCVPGSITGVPTVDTVSELSAALLS